MFIAAIDFLAGYHPGSHRLGTVGFKPVASLFSKIVHATPLIDLIVNKNNATGDSAQVLRVCLTMDESLGNVEAHIDKASSYRSKTLFGKKARTQWRDRNDHEW